MIFVLPFPPKAERLGMPRVCLTPSSATALWRAVLTPPLGSTIVLSLSWPWGWESGRANPAPLLCHVVVRSMGKMPPLPLAIYGRWGSWSSSLPAIALLKSGQAPCLGNTGELTHLAGALVSRPWEHEHGRSGLVPHLSQPHRPPPRCPSKAVALKRVASVPHLGKTGKLAIGMWVWVSLPWGFKSRRTSPASCSLLL